MAWDSEDTVIGKAQSTETRSYRITQGDVVLASGRKIRSVELSTLQSIGVFNACPSSDAIDPNPVSTTGVAVYDSRVSWDPITHKAVKTTVKRTSHGSWEVEDETSE